MLNSKRPRTTDWAVEPPDKRILYYQAQNLWQARPEQPQSFHLSPSSTPSFVPAAEPFSNYPLQEALRDQQVHDNNLYYPSEQLCYPSVRQFDFNISASAECSQYAFNEVVLAAPNGDLAMGPMLGKPSDAAQTSYVCFGAVCS